MASLESKYVRATFVKNTSPVDTPVEVQRQEWEAAVAQAAGVKVRLEIWEEMWHVWHGWAATLPEGREAIGRIGEFVRERLKL